MQFVITSEVGNQVAAYVKKTFKNIIVSVGVFKVVNILLYAIEKG